MNHLSVASPLRKACLLVAFCAGGLIEPSVAQPQAAPQAPHSVIIVRNDSPSKVSIEVRADGNWESVAIESQKEADVRGDRIRVSTTRDDNAMITIDLPIQVGKKYRVFWNQQTSMWDLGGTT